MRSQVQPKQPDRRAETTQSAGEALRRQVKLSGLLDGVIVANKDMPAAGAVRVVHGLGRRPRGWFVIDSTGAAPMLYRTAWDASSLTLQSGAASKVSFWVF